MTEDGQVNGILALVTCSDNNTESYITRGSEIVR